MKHFRDETRHRKVGANQRIHGNNYEQLRRPSSLVRQESKALPWFTAWDRYLGTIPGSDAARESLQGIGTV